MVSAVVSACMQPPNEQRIAELPRRRARTSLHSSSVLERMRTTSPSDRSVCWHATCGEKRRRGEHLHAAPICVLAGHLEARPLPNGSHSIKRNQGRSYLEARAPCPMEAIQSSAIKGDLTSKLAPLAQWNAAPMSAVLSVALTCSSGVVSSTPASP